MPTPRTPHTCPKHDPGSLGCYKAHKCRCEDCTSTATKAAVRLQLLWQRGLRGTVDSGRVRRHIKALTSTGMTQKQIAALAGVSIHTAKRAVRGDRLLARSAARLLAVQYIDPRWRVSALATSRRLQALAAIGWDCGELAARVGISATRLRTIRMGHGGLVSVETERAVAAVYDLLWCQPRPHLQVRAVARRNRWAPPLAWDDETIGDPDARASGVRTGPDHKAQADLIDLLELGYSVPEVARIQGMDKDSIYRTLLRRDRLDLWRRAA